jgi:hypothetical protein
MDVHVGRAEIRVLRLLYVPYDLDGDVAVYHLCFNNFSV